MAAWGDDLRYFYSGVLGDSTTFAVTDAGSTKVAEALAPGRYLVHPIDLVGRIWIKQGPFATVVAAAALPSFPMDANSIIAIEITVVAGLARTGQVQGPSDYDGIAARGATDGTCTLVVTKISRDKQ